MTPPIDGVAGATPISSVTSPAAGTSAVGDKNNMDKDMFLKLLVAQMKYQDPMNPADSTQFVAQTAQFTSVEKLTQIATQNESLIQAQNILGASSLVGRSVNYLDSDGTTKSGVVSAVKLDLTNGTTARIGDADVPLARINQISQSGSPTGSPSTASTPST